MQCIYCEEERRLNQRTCKKCHAKYMRTWRKKHPLNEQQKIKGNCRSYTNTYKRRNKIVKGKCLICGSDNVEIHHPDYNNPLKIIWLCRNCHLKYHKLEKNNLNKLGRIICQK